MTSNAALTSASLSRTLSKIERTAADATDADAMLEVVSRTIADALDADAHVFVRLDPLSALWTGAVGGGYEPETCKHFAEHLFLNSPLADYSKKASADERVRVVRAREVPPDDVYARHFFGDLGFAEEVHASYAVGAQSFGHLTVSRRRGAFPAVAPRFVEGTLAPITAALRRLLAKEMLEAVPGEGLGLLFVDEEGRVTAANERGQRILEGAREIDRGGFQRSALSVVTALARRSHGGGGAGTFPRVVFVEPETRQRYRLVAERMLPSAAGRGKVLVMAEPIRALDSVELLRTSGLSEREAEVAIVLLRGFKSAEGARSLGMSEHTFLTHLKSVYKKLGVRSRGELASLVLSGI